MAPTVEREGKTRTAELLLACVYITWRGRARQPAGTAGVRAEVKKTPTSNVRPVPGTPLRPVAPVHCWRANCLPAVGHMCEGARTIEQREQATSWSIIRRHIHAPTATATPPIVTPSPTSAGLAHAGHGRVRMYFPQPMGCYHSVQSE